MSRHLLRRAEIDAMEEKRVQHQFNDNAVRHTRTLGTATGMERIGIHEIRLEPGRDSTTHHFHDCDEEFVYILSGTGKARIGDEEFEIGPGDFMGFGAPSPAHSMRNTGETDLVYLVGGERWPVDVVHYPDIDRTMIKSHGRRAWTDDGTFTDLPPR